MAEKRCVPTRRPPLVAGAHVLGGETPLALDVPRVLVPPPHATIRST